jgi:hypothetical protein
MPDAGDLVLNASRTTLIRPHERDLCAQPESHFGRGKVNSPQCSQDTIRIYSNTTVRPAQAGRTNQEPGMDGRPSLVTADIAVRP